MYRNNMFKLLINNLMEYRLYAIVLLLWAALHLKKHRGIQARNKKYTGNIERKSRREEINF